MNSILSLFPHDEMEVKDHLHDEQLLPRTMEAHCHVGLEDEDRMDPEDEVQNHEVFKNAFWRLLFDACPSCKCSGQLRA
jgi:hypothetical protein